MQIDNEIVALDFDLACSLRLQMFDSKNKVEEIINLGRTIGVMSGTVSADVFKEKENVEEW